ncbi:unnamed protein product [Paramecium pentaurelia]|uniref:Uncharacterized protein n=2 Tax=Paramecium pentaurelia TaxID=43138 RepID=A0A8S1S5W6_9CILI|nr:unnamed protein product [Paramecium pentaurelia]
MLNQQRIDQQETLRNEYQQTRPISQQFVYTSGVQQGPYVGQQVQQEEFVFDGRNQAFNQQGVQFPNNFVTAQVTNYPTINPCNPCQASPLHMQIVVVNREEIEAPWRLECEYLQSVITELESRQLETKIVEKVIEKEKIVKDTESITQLENELNRLRLSNQQDVSDLRRQISELQMQNANLNSQLKQKDQELLLIKTSSSSSESRYKQLETELQNWKNQCRSKDQELAMLRDQIQDLQDANSKLSMELSSLKLIIQQKDNELEKYRITSLELRSAASESRDAQSRIRELEMEVNNLKSLLYQRTTECEDLRNQLALNDKEYSSKLNQYRFQISDLEQEILRLKTEIEKLRQMLANKDHEIDDLHLRIQYLEEQGTTVVQEKVTFLSSEIEVWKQKFIKINHDYNECQEQLMMAQAELEALQKQSKKEVVVEKRTVTRSTVGSSSIQKQY